MFFFTLLLFGGIQARIVALNGHYFLKNGGHFVLSIKVHMLYLSYTSEANLEIMFLFLIFWFSLFNAGKLHWLYCASGGSVCSGS